jgi:hypothetical protein
MVLRSSVVRLAAGFTFGALLATSAVLPLDAKGSTVKLSITGGQLPKPIELTDGPLLESSNVYGGGFLGEVVPPPTAAKAKYRIAFHVDAPAWYKQAPQVRYVVSYVKDAATGEGFIYLPARDEPGYWINEATIERLADEGKWHRAAQRWASAINSRLP